MKLDNLNQLYVRCSSHRSPIRYSSYHANQAEIKLFFCTPPYDKFVFIQLIYGTTILCCIFYHSRYRINRKWFLANFVKRFRNKSLICAKCQQFFPAISNFTCISYTPIVYFSPETTKGAEDHGSSTTILGSY